MTSSPPLAQSRLVSLDVFRGITMFLLIAEGAGIYHAISDSSLNDTFLGTIFTQFHHHPWNGLRFWDLVQPFFMFIVGVAMPFSFGRRWARGDSYSSTLKHAVLRSFLLLALGIGVYVVAAGHLTLELWNVLAQLSVTYLIAFLMMRKSITKQLLFTVGLLVLSEMLYRLWTVPGFDQAFTPGQNFGSWVDYLLMGKVSGGHWVAFNAIPTTAHTMWGVMAGLILQNESASKDKIKTLLIAGLIGIVIGYGLDPITPVIKRICTTSFVIVSGGWCLLALALCYWLVDVKGHQKWAQFAIVFGMNPLAVYLFGEVGGNGWLRNIVRPFTEGFLGWTGDGLVLLITAMIVLWMNWYVVNWLFKRKIFIRI
ncbi:MAG: acyltransferase family protein [Rhodothermales bacterium]